MPNMKRVSSSGRTGKAAGKPRKYNVAPESMLPLQPRVFWIMLVLSEAPRHGYAILKEAHNRSDADLGLGPTTLYRLLYKLVDDNLVEGVDAPVTDVDERRQYYGLTPFGSAVLAAEVRRLERMVELGRSAVGRPAMERGQ
jgi:DNA-binding PadR family transcriptional regulator